MRITNILITTDEKTFAVAGFSGHRVQFAPMLGEDETIIRAESNKQPCIQETIRKMNAHASITIAKGWPMENRVGFYAVRSL